MTPSFIVYYHGNGTGGDSKFIRNFTLHSAITYAISYEANLFLVKFSIPPLRSMLKLSFPRRVLSVLTASAKEKMIWIYASWIIASRAVMAQLQSIWNWSIDNFPRKSVGLYLLTVYRKCTVSTRLDTAEPKPTGLRFVNKRPKPKFDRAKVLLFMSGWKITVEKFTAVATLNMHLKPFFGCYEGQRFAPLALTSFKVAL